MPIPAARVKVEILQIGGLPPATLAAGNTRYARAYLQAGAGPQLWVTGRSRPIPDAGGDFDVTTEAAPWSFEANLNPGEIFSIGVEMREDRGDLAPPAATVILDPLAGTIKDPWASGDRTFGSGPTVKVRVTTTLVNPVDKAFLARAAAASKASGALVIPQGYFVEIVDIPGLYKPNAAIATSVQASQHVAGYTSNDNLGRIFTNRLPNGNWSKDQQFIEVQVKVTAYGGSTLPAGARIDWTIEDVDDPTNDASEFHRDWGRYVDANDYDGTGKPIGAHPDDNASAFKAGNANETLLFGAAVAAPTARWAAATGGPAPAASSRTKAKTPITVVTPQTGNSSVRVHCTNVLGTNLLVRANLSGTPAGAPVFGAATGIMTMWSRIDVEVVRMAGAHSVTGALADIPKFFLPACVQLDFQTERVVSGALDKKEIATSDDDSVFDPATIGWVNNAGVFTHKGQPGWFFLGAARFPYPLPSGGSSATLLSGPAYKFTGQVLEVTGAAATAEFVDVTWKVGGKDQNAGFSVNRNSAAPPPVVAGGKTTMKLFGNDVTPDFTGHDADGSISHAMASMILFLPQHQVPPGGALVSGGFHIPAVGAKIEVFGPGAVFTTGVSPTVTNPAKPGEEFFAGRTILFTHTEAFSTGTPPVPKANFDKRVLQTVVHEFIHAFGMPHKCGNWNWRTPRQPSGHSCCMNYFSTWLLDASKNVTPDTVGKQAADMCGRHLMEVRRVHLERNLGLKW